MFRSLQLIGTFLLTLAACMWATVAISREPIESDLTQRTTEALEQVDGLRMEYFEVTFVGLDGVVSGEVQTEQQLAAVQERVASIYGARVVETELEVIPFDTPWVLVKRDKEGAVRIDGLLVNEEERTALVAAMGGQPESDIEVREKVEPAEWIPELVPVASRLLALATDEASVELRDGKLSLAGELPDPQAKREFVALAEEKVGGAGISLDFALSVAPPPEPSRFEMVAPVDGEIVVRGRLADLESAERLLSVLRRGGDWIINDQIKVAENTTPAPWVEGLTFLLPSMMAEVVAAEVRVDGARLRIGGQVEEGMAEAISEVAKQNFPPGEYEVQNRLRVIAPPREAMVSVLTFPDGRVQLKGLLGEAALKQRLVDAVRGAMEVGGDLLSDELQVEANVMEAGWVDSLEMLIPPYVQQVKRGGLTIFSNILAVEAVINSDADRDSIWAMTEQYFPDDQYRRLLELRFPEEVEGGIAAEGEPEID